MLTLDTDIAALHATPAQPLPFAPSLSIRAFVLERARGDLLIYSTSDLPADLAVARHYLNHGHEAMFASPEIEAPRFVHAADRGPVLAAGYRLRGTFTRRHRLDEDFEVIPTPGHTPGATTYLWDSGEHRFLFTGDTIYLRNGEWVAAVLGSSDRAAYLDSLALIRELDFDVLVPWAASAGQPYYAVTSRAEARRRIDAITARVAAGSDH